MDLYRVERLTAGAVGEPGQRTFYLQARRGSDLVTVVVEKQQVELLSQSILEILTRAGKETGEGPGESEMELEEPLEPRWQAGRLAIGYDEDRDLMLLEIEELVETEESEEGEGTPQGEGEEGGREEANVAETDRVRLWATREQMLALSRQGVVVAARGRPRCRFCGNPIDLEGHTCPAMNGHERPSSR